MGRVNVLVSVEPSLPVEVPKEFNREETADMQDMKPEFSPPTDTNIFDISPGIYFTAQHGVDSLNRFKLFIRRLPFSGFGFFRHKIFGFGWFGFLLIAEGIGQYGGQQGEPREIVFHGFVAPFQEFIILPERQPPEFVFR